MQNVERSCKLLLNVKWEPLHLLTDRYITWEAPSHRPLEGSRPALNHCAVLQHPGVWNPLSDHSFGRRAPRHHTWLATPDREPAY